MYQRIMCCSKLVWESGPIPKVRKEISAWINYSENITYWKESKRSDVLAEKCCSFLTINSWWASVEGASTTLRKFCNLYLHLSLATAFPDLKLRRNWFFPWKLTISSKIGSPSPTHMPHSKDYPCHLTKYESSISQLFSELGKIWKYSLG